MCHGESIVVTSNHPHQHKDPLTARAKAVWIIWNHCSSMRLNGIQVDFSSFLTDLAHFLHDHQFNSPLSLFLSPPFNYSLLHSLSLSLYFFSSVVFFPSSLHCIKGICSFIPSVQSSLATLHGTLNECCITCMVQQHSLSPLLFLLLL